MLLVALAFGLLTFAGCANVSFKRGASPDTMSADERTCRDSTTDDESFADCMRKRGWYMSGGVGSANEGKDVGSAPAPKAAEPAPAAPVLPSDPPTSPPAAVVHPAMTPNPIPTPTATAVGSAGPSPMPTPTVPESTSMPTVSAEPVDPTATVSVGSWWKFGGNAAGLDRAINTCVEKLGAEHRPDPAAQVVTVAMRGCLREAGWYPFGSPGL